MTSEASAAGSSGVASQAGGDPRGGKVSHATAQASIGPPIHWVLRTCANQRTVLPPCGAFGRYHSQGCRKDRGAPLVRGLDPKHRFDAFQTRLLEGDGATLAHALVLEIAQLNVNGAAGRWLGRGIQLHHELGQAIACAGDRRRLAAREPNPEGWLWLGLCFQTP
jgi:hypothetical protein